MAKAKVYCIGCDHFSYGNSCDRNISTNQFTGVITGNVIGRDSNTNGACSHYVENIGPKPGEVVRTSSPEIDRRKYKWWGRKQP